ncbi:MAG: hypothetical protein KGJ19_05630 [Betaproteobacteria bacterium]|nr:hypothetical protein [Betaproteobacteria bacterium]
MAKNIIQYFHPKDDTPGCTMEANKFTGMDDNISRDECLGRAEFRHVLCGAYVQAMPMKFLIL